jgi:hypothetical protein
MWGDMLPRFLVALVLVSMTAVGCSSADDSEPVDGTVDSALASTAAKTAFEFFAGKGLEDFQAAAIVGNLQQESGISPSSVQPGGPGRGIAQWSTGARWNSTHGDNLSSFAQSHGGSMLSLGTQLQFIWFELENFPHYGLSALRDASTISEATLVFSRDFEACGTCVQTHRLAYAKAALRAYGNAP